MVENEYKRYPFIPTRINSLNSETRSVSVFGTVISKDSSIMSFILDDGEGKITVITNNSERFSELSEGDKVRVLAKVWGEGTELELQSDIIQDFSNIDLEKYKETIL